MVRIGALTRSRFIDWLGSRNQCKDLGYRKLDDDEIIFSLQNQSDGSSSDESIPIGYKGP